MAVSAVSITRNKQKSRTVAFTGSGAGDILTNSHLTSGALAYGPVATFLATVFANEAAVNVAAAAAGIQVTPVGTGYASGLKWAATAEAPTLTFTGAAGTGYVVISAPGIGQ